MGIPPRKAMRLRREPVRAMTRFAVRNGRGWKLVNPGDKLYWKVDVDAGVRHQGALRRVADSASASLTPSRPDRARR
jgi:hypothetical protein